MEEWRAAGARWRFRPGFGLGAARARAGAGAGTGGRPAGAFRWGEAGLLLHTGSWLSSSSRAQRREPRL